MGPSHLCFSPCVSADALCDQQRDSATVFPATELGTYCTLSLAKGVSDEGKAEPSALCALVMDKGSLT